ncbi:DUF4407 domain-containing protein [Catenuloplanes atrovinosus]|uniref:DUF4407 domain-containing protein n=1 Tax=Catenuloplanes atrovinosus TaxID=137266 RepID=A0AAE3YWF7_9ACTN|nr:DUF4407 domain-containing protein [Catenuloplanes atrovinosus]MDR7279871.1 hypothetical protein [Catenuloplanes atrovinosus]
MSSTDARPARRRPHLFLRASGVDPGEAIFWGEAGRYRVFGALVLFTTLMATATVFWAVTIATDAPWQVAVAVALIWGFGIFQIDRWLISAHVERDGVLHRLWLLVPRLAIAVPMGLLIAWFAMLGVGAKEIRQELDVDRLRDASAISAQVRDSSELASQRDTLLAEKAALQTAYDRAAAAIPALQRAFDEECNGTGGTRTPGCGPIAQVKLGDLNAGKAARDAAQRRLAARGAEIDAAVQQLDRRIAASADAASVSTAHNDGVFARRAALARVLAVDPEARRLYHLLEVVFVVVDLVPAVAKVFSPVSMVDIARRQRRARAREELEAATAAERESPDVHAALVYAAAQRAESLREQADARRALDNAYLTDREFLHREAEHRVAQHEAALRAERAPHREMPHARPGRRAFSGRARRRRRVARTPSPLPHSSVRSSKEHD